MIATVVIPGKVQTDHRARVTSRGTYMPREYQAYLRAARLHGFAARPRGWSLAERYAVRVVVHEPDRRSRDLDNAAKGPLDGLRGVLWHDDRQIDRLVIERGEVRREAPCVVVTVRVQEGDR